MTVASLIADLVRAGTDPELVGRVAEALAEREPVAVVDQQAERRRAADRERKARLRNSAESAESDAKSAPLDPPPNVPGPLNTPPYNPPQKQEKGSARGCRLPEGWQPTEKHFVLGRSLGFSDQAIRKAADAMRDWADSNRHRAVGRKADWDKTFNNWLRNNVPKGHSARDGPRRSNVIDAADALNARIRERYNAEPDADRYQQALPSPDRW